MLSMSPNVRAAEVPTQTKLPTALITFCASLVVADVTCRPKMDS